jgi:hypothetical protein
MPQARRNKVTACMVLDAKSVETSDDWSSSALNLDTCRLVREVRQE